MCYKGRGTDRLTAARLCWLPRALSNDVVRAGHKARRQKALRPISRCTNRCSVSYAEGVMGEKLSWSCSPCSYHMNFSGVASCSLQHEELKWLLTSSSYWFLRENYEHP